MASSSKQNWQLGDAGILRKKEDEDELLVFGYSCKLFRDDEKALYIDQGKHLIPWMGDDTLKIDRYDGRGTLYDLKQYEPLPGGYDESLWVGLSDSERHVEHLCNEERYRALHHNEDEEALYQEEELKRLHKALDTKTYGEVEFNYDRESFQPKTDLNGEGGLEAQDGEEGGDEPFKAPPELDIPVNMVLPESVKLNAIIEKTALFISGQGAQMEILLKMKQANNPQFEFLSYNSPLHPYYRHLQMAIKTGRYQPKPEEEKLAGGNNPHEEADEDDHYLHPSLAPSSSKVELAPSIPSIAYKPSANCAYSMLVNRIKDKQAAFSIQPPGTADAVLPIAEPVVTAPVIKPTPLVIEATPVLYKNSTDTEKIISKSSNTAVVLPTVVAAQVPLVHSQVPIKVFTPVVDTPKPVETVPTNVPFAPQVTESSGTVPSMSFLTPPTDVQLIIDKMASYVAKNGREFETIVRNKKDPRFAFLEVTHQYYPYYLHKVDVYERLENPKPVLQPTTTPAIEPPKKDESDESSESEHDDVGNSQEGSQKSAEEDEEEAQSLATKPLVAPVCFSIKKPKDTDTPLDKKSALPVEESTDEEEENKEAGEEVKIVDTVPAKHEEEVIDLTEDTAAVATDERREKRKDRPAEEKVKDKLATAAREKVAAKARERQLQMERKRRAAAFLTMLRKTPGNPKIQSSQSRDAGSKVSGDEEDVTSVPSSVSSSSESPNPNRHEDEERLNTNGKSNPLLARIQGGRDVVKRPARSSSSESDHPRVKKKKLKEKKKKSSHKRERTNEPSRSHRHRKEEDDSRQRKEVKTKYYKEDDQRKIKKSKKQVRLKSPAKGHRTRSHHHRLDTSASKSKTPRERPSRKKQKRDRKSSLSEHSS